MSRKTEAKRDAERAAAEADARALNPPNPSAGVAEPASIEGAPPDSVAALMAEIAELRAKLKVSETARSDAEKAALAAAEAQGMLMQREIQEVPTGKFLEVSRCDGYKVVGYKEDGREILRPKWKKVEIPTFFYKIDLPPVGGFDIKLNQQSFYHGVVYEVDQDTLATLKEIVYRSWEHDRSLHANDENFYRTPQNKVLSAARRM